MRLLIGLALVALACALLAAGVGAQERSPALEARSASSLTVAWSWSGQTAAAFEVAWRARGDDDQTAWRSVRKDADDRRHIIENLDAGVHYVVRVRGLDAADRPIDDLRGVFATNWSAPRLLRVIASDDGALTVAWSQPSDWTPRGWRLSWRVAGSQTAGGTIDLPAAARSRRIDGLSTGTDYRIRLTALNSRGGESPAQTLRATAADAGPATPKLTALSWSGLAIRAEWETVPRASGYDLIWRASDESSGLAGRLEVTGTSAEFEVPAAGAYWVELQARIGSGPTAVRGDRSPPRNLILRPAPHYLRALSFDGERARLVWPGTNAPRYDLEWGEQSGTKQTETRDGRATLLEVGPLEGGKTYEFRVRARNVWGESGWSPPATLTPTLWPETPPPGLWLFATFNHRTGGIDVTPPAVAGAPWYEAQWVNYADDAERGRARSSGAERRVRLSRAGGFENGLWLIRVRAGPWGTWSTRAHYHRVISQPPRLALALRIYGTSCTEAGLRWLEWDIAGGVPPYTLSVDGQSVNASHERISVFCGSRPSDPQPCDPEPKLRQTFKATVTDTRGVAAQSEWQVVVAAPPPRPMPGTVLSSAIAPSAAVRLGWAAVTEGSDVCAYELRYQSTSWDADSWPEEWTTVDETIAASATEYLHGDLDPDRRYRYQVRARNNVGAGEWSRPFPRTAARPGAAMLTARTAASGSVALSWSVTSSSTTRWEYRQRPVDGSWGDWTAIADSDASTTGHTVDSLTGGASYQFRVRAVGTGGTGAASATATAVAGLTPTVSSDRQTLRYDDLDSAGGATAHGSYAFLTDAADLTSGATTFAGVSGAEALLFNASGNAGRNYTDVLSTVEVGDRITWFAGCWYHYRVTEVLTDPPAPARKLFRIALEAEDPAPCGSTAEQQADPIHFDEWRDRYVAFGWDNKPPSEPDIGSDGIRILPFGYSVEGGRTYRLNLGASPSDVLIDIPVGMRLAWVAGILPFGDITYHAYLDEVSGGELLLDAYTGRNGAYSVPTAAGETEPPADVVARFKALIDSMRVEPLP